MGQKTNALGFRLITTKNHFSNWYSNNKIYSSLIREDYNIRLNIIESFKKILQISNIEINRVVQSTPTEECVSITIFALFPKVADISILATLDLTTPEDDIEIEDNFLNEYAYLILKQNIKTLIIQLKKENQKYYYITIKLIRNSFEDSILIAKFIADQLEKRIPFRRIVKEAIRNIKSTPIKGMKIQLSGRLNGINIARSEWKQNGAIPLHTLQAKIDYTCQAVKTIYGMIGIKIWLFLGF